VSKIMDKDAEMSQFRVESRKYFVKISCSIKFCASKALVDCSIFIPGLHWEGNKELIRGKDLFWGNWLSRSRSEPIQRVEHFKTGEVVEE